MHGPVFPFGFRVAPVKAADQDDHPAFVGGFDDKTHAQCVKRIQTAVFPIPLEDT